METLGYDEISGQAHPIPFIALPEVVDDINAWNGDTLKFYESVLKCIFIHKTNFLNIGNIDIHLVNNKTPRGNMTFYVLKDGVKKAIYACCDVKPFVENQLYYDADILIVGLVSDNGILQDGSSLELAPFRNEMFSLEEVIEIKRKYRIKKVVITHIAEIWGKSYGYQGLGY